MNRFARTLAAVSCAALVAALATGCVATMPAAADEPLLAHLGQVLRAENAPGSVVLQAATPEVRVGQPVALDVVPRRGGYLYLYHVGTDGRSLSMLFPNAADGANFMNGPLRLPRATWKMTARGPQGVGHFLAVLAEQPQDLGVLAEGVRNNAIRISGNYAASMTQIRELP